MIIITGHPIVVNCRHTCMSSNQTMSTGYSSKDALQIVEINKYNTERRIKLALNDTKKITHITKINVECKK